MITSIASQPYCEPVPSRLSGHTQTRRILVIDDDPADRDLYRFFLKADSVYSYHIDEAGLGKVAIEMSKKSEYDCVLLDYYLSDLSGLQILEALNALFENAVPVIMLTGQGNETIAVETMRAGAVDYLPKRHVSAESLKRAMNNAIEKSNLRNAVARKTEKLKEKNAELVRKHEEIQRFYQTVSHELKTPLTSMKEFVSIILDELAGPISSEQREYLELVNGSCIQMANDVNDLLDVTRLETGKYRIDLVPTNLPALLKNTVHQMWALAKEKSIELKLAVAEDIPGMLLDQRRIEQVIGNLVGNATKFTQAGGRIDVSAELDTDGKCVCIAVRDNGCGIAEDKLQHVFERLFQINPEQSFTSGDTSNGGLGLGLTISKELVKLHGGEISVESEVGKGSTFFIVLPVKRSKEKDQ